MVRHEIAEPVKWHIIRQPMLFAKCSDFFVKRSPPLSGFSFIDEVRSKEITSTERKTNFVAFSSWFEICFKIISATFKLT